MSKRNSPSIQALRQQHHERKKRREENAKAKRRARRRIEDRADKKAAEEGRLMPRWDTPADHDEDFEEYLLKSNLRKKEKSRAMSGTDLRHALSSWSLEELSTLWDLRRQKLSSQYDAAVLLAQLRFDMGIDQTLSSPERLFEHDAIKDLADVLPPGQLTTDQKVEEDDGTESERRLAFVRKTVREGQAKFRERLFEHYGKLCLISGPRTPKVIEAAHIAPYEGRGSNDLENGLLLRVDLHRLFDCGLLGIEPETLTVHISKNAVGYDAFQGAKLRSENAILASRVQLRRRWAQYKETSR